MLPRYPGQEGLRSGKSMTHTEMTGATVPGDSGGGERRVLVLSAGGTGGLELPHADFRLQCVSKPLAPPTPAGQVLSTLDGKCSCVAIPHASFQTSSYFQEIDLQSQHNPNQNPSRIFSLEIDTLVPKCIQKGQGCKAEGLSRRPIELAWPS